jgi:predicted aspartyl protease
MKNLPAAVVVFAMSVMTGSANAGTVSMSRDGVGHLTIPVTIGKMGPYTFVVDTAAQGSAISATLVQRAGLAAQAGGHVDAASGTQQVPYTTLEDFDSAVFQRPSEFALVLSHGLEPGDDGITGMDIFSGGRIVFDFKANTFSSVASGTADAEFARVPVELRAGTFVIADVVIDGVKAKAIIDTGARVTVANAKLQSALGFKEGYPRLSPREALGGASGDHTAAVKAEVGRITIGAVDFENPTIALANLSVFRSLGLGDEPALLTGIDLLRQLHAVAVDYPRSELQLKR